MVIRSTRKTATERRFQRRARQDADKQALQHRILETARTELARGTMETVSIQKIADTLGYSKGTILKYFPTRLLLLLAVKQQNLEEVALRLERVRARNPDSEIRLRRVMETYLDYWIDNPDHFRSLYSMAGTIEDRRFPDGVYFGDTEVARRSFDIFVISVREFLTGMRVEASTALSLRLTMVLLSASHGVISLPLGTPTMKWPDVRLTGKLVVGNLIDSWIVKLAAARKSRSWPKITISAFT